MYTDKVYIWPKHNIKNQKPPNTVIANYLYHGNVQNVAIV